MPASVISRVALRVCALYSVIWLALTVSWMVASCQSWRAGNRRDCLGGFGMYCLIMLVRALVHNVTHSPYDCAHLSCLPLTVAVFPSPQLTIPPLLFLIFIASNDAGATSIPPMKVFAPLFVWLVSACFLDAESLCDSHH